LGIGDGDWGLGIGPNPQSPIPNPHPQSPIPTYNIIKMKSFFIKKIKILKKYIKYLSWKKKKKMIQI
jgi:hypothetical protein